MNHYSQSLSEQELYTAEELKIEDEEEVNSMTFRDFYKIVDDLKRLHPTFSPQRFKEFMKSDDFKDQYDDIVFAYLDDFGYPDLSNDYVKDVVISLSSIGIEIPQKPRENNNVVEDKTDELLPEIPVLSRQDTAFEAKV
jgi:hypothetical protein